MEYARTLTPSLSHPMGEGAPANSTVSRPLLILVMKTRKFCAVMGGLIGSALLVSTLQAQPKASLVPRPGFTLSLWAREPMLRSPVALSFDDQGRLYVVETARRSSVDIDIRAHSSWIVEDLANQSIDDLRRFFRSKMSPEKSAENASWLRDYNGDGSH